MPSSYLCCFKCVVLFHCQTEAEALPFTAMFPLVSKEPERKLYVHSPRHASPELARSGPDSTILLLLLFRDTRQLVTEKILLP